MFPGLGGTSEPRGETCRPGPAPAGSSAACSNPAVEGDLSRFPQFRGAFGIELIAGVNADQMGKVSVFGLGFIEVFVPFLELTVPADLQRWQFV